MGCLGRRGEVGLVNRKEVTYGSRELSNVLRPEVTCERISGGDQLEETTVLECKPSGGGG